MTNCKLLVYYPENFRIFSGVIQSKSPFKIKLQGLQAADLEAFVYLKLKWYEEDTLHTATVRMLSADGETLTLEASAEVQTSEDESHYIEFAGSFDMVKLSPDTQKEIKMRVDRVNSRFRSNLTTQVKKILLDETLTNQYILKLLMQIDSKMDELLDSLKQDDAPDGMTEVLSLKLGGDSIAFVAPECDIRTGDSVYIQSMPKNSSGLNFASLCTVTDVIKSDNSCICEADYSYIDETTRETIIHYIFEKDRERLKRKRS